MSRSPLRTRLTAEPLDERTVPAVHTWNGTGDFWSTDSNWEEGVAPQAGESNVVIRFRSADDLSVMNVNGLQVDRIEFVDSAAVTLRLDRDLVTNSGARIVDSTNLGNAITPGSNGVLYIGGTGAGLTIETPFRPIFGERLKISAVVTGNTGQGITKTGEGSLELAPTSTSGNGYDGPTVVAEGQLFVATGGLGKMSDVVVGDDAEGNAVLVFTGDSSPKSVTVLSDGLYTQQFTSGGSSGAPRLRLGSAAGGGQVEIGSNSAVVVAETQGGVSSVAAPTPSIIESSSSVGGLYLIGAGQSADGSFSGTGPVTFDVADGSAEVDLDISATVASFPLVFPEIGTGITKTGNGYLLLSGTNTYTGPTTVAAGTLGVFGTQTGSPITVNAGRFGGTGTVGPVTVAGGTLAPGLGTATAPAVLTTGNLALSGGAYAPLLSGSAGGPADRVKVLGTVAINGASLAPTLAGATPAVGAAFLVIDNDGTDPVVGTFAGVPEGGTVTVGGRQFKVSYVGGDGNDVVLTAKSSNAAPVLAGGSPAGTTVEYTISGGVLVAGRTITFPGLSGVVHTTTADVNGDGTPDYVGAASEGQPGRVVVLSGTDLAVLADEFPYGTGFTGGINVAAADFDGDGFADVAVAPDHPTTFGAVAPEVIVFSGADGSVLARFLGLNDPTGAGADPGFKGGLRLGAGDVDGDGTPDLLVGAGTGGGPRITVWSGKGFAGGGQPTVNPLINLFVFESSQRGGAYIAAGDLNADGIGDMVFGGGPGGSTRIRSVDGRLLFGLPADQLRALDLDQSASFPAGLLRDNFFAAGDASFRGGVRLTTRDVDGDGTADIVTGSGDGAAGQVRVYTAPLLDAARGVRDPASQDPLAPFGADVLAAGVFVG